MQSIGVEGLGGPTKRWQAGVGAEGLKHKQGNRSVTKGGHSQLGWTSEGPTLRPTLCTLWRAVGPAGPNSFSIHFAKMSTEAILELPHQAVRRYKSEHEQRD